MNSGSLERHGAETADVLDAILSHSRDSIMLLTLNGDIEFANSRAASLLGLDNANEAIGKPWRSFGPNRLLSMLDAAVELAATGVSKRFEGAMRDGDGAVRFWEVTVSPVRGSGGSITHLLAVSTDVTTQVEAAERGRKRWEIAEEKVGYADVIARELRHRLKNQLAVVGAVARLLARHTADSTDLARKLEEKLIALAHAQDLLTILRDQPISAREAVEQVLKASGAGERIEIAEIPATPLPDEAVQALALILGELQTNALKHGALRDDEGRVQLSGRDEDGVLTMSWQEHCARPVRPVEHGGGGFQLIERLGSAGGRPSTIGWADDGIVVEFHICKAA